MSDLKNKDCPAVQAHIAMLQGIISRMASNSANCKTWVVTIIAAMLVLIVDKNICDKQKLFNCVLNQVTASFKKIYRWEIC